MKKVAITIFLKKRYYDRVKGSFGSDLSKLLTKYFSKSWSATYFDPDKKR